MQKIEAEVSTLLEKVFPKHRIKLDARAETDVDKAYTPFKSGAEVLMGPDGGYFGKVAQQGSGARRTLLWAALKYLTETEAARQPVHGRTSCFSTSLRYAYIRMPSVRPAKSSMRSRRQKTGR
ncbi:hypothetical protein ACFJIX_10045 [Roseateles sp. UC29_93]|uniref:hypothetical protein n=1 Tax=Roseateles sp. UC29_93 TaxID=3350177 RepID=UPI00366C8162